MTIQSTTTKQDIIEAAITLFNTKGFQGTSIRDIANKAKVNSANISYYFNGKQGLLEACLVHFFEPYLSCLEEEAGKIGLDSATLCLNRTIRKILQFQSENQMLARFVWREVTIDSQLSREVISSYLMKERFYFKKMIQSLLKDHRIAYPDSMLIIQLKGMLMMPYLNSHYIGEVWGINPKEPYFVNKYYDAIQEWLLSLIGNIHQPYHFDASAYRKTI